jgi:nitroreductase
MNEDESKYLEVIEKFQHCQRNWDLEKTVDDETIDYLLEVGYNVPTKQNLNSFKIVCIKDRDEVLKWASIARNSDDTITNVGENTKQFMDKGGLQNPQTNAN